MDPSARSGSPEWWRTAVVYQVYPRSFADSDGDGVGDLRGIVSRLGHVARLGADAIWLSPFFTSPQRDGGYDVADYCDVDPLFGTLADFDELVSCAHGLGLRVIVDIVPNHTSSEHPWFRAALASAPGSPQRARYLFRDGRGPDGSEPPNDWESVFGGSAWTRLSDGQWYLHMFDESQPDLDWTDQGVRDAFEDVLRFWLRRGADGFRVDVATGLVKAAGLPDRRAEGVIDEFTPGPMFDQEGVHEIYRSWRRVLDEHETDPTVRRLALVAEAWVEPMSRMARYVRPDEMQVGFNFPFLVCPWDASEYRAVITATLRELGAVGAPATWVLSNHDGVRHASRLGLPEPGARPNGISARDPQPDPVIGLRRARAATLFALALPGSAYLYQGEELGLPDHTTLPDEARRDPTFVRSGGVEVGRDGCRVPIPWSSQAPAFGFSPTGRSWLPQPEDWGRYAADQQDGVPGSTLELYRRALALRRNLGLGSGRLEWLDGFPSDVLAFRSSRPGASTDVLANLGTETVGLPPGHRVLLASEDLPGDGTLPPDTTVWLDRA